MKNCIMTSREMVLFDESMTQGIYTTREALIRHEQFGFNILLQSADLLANKADTPPEYVDVPITEKTTLTAIEFQPCLSIVLTRELMENHFYSWFPLREEMIESIVQNYTFEQDSRTNEVVEKVNVFATEEGIKDFVDTGILSVFPYPIYAPFSKEECCQFFRRLIHLMETGRMDLHLIRRSEIPDMRDVHVEIRVGESHSDVFIKTFREDLSSNMIIISNPLLVKQFENFIEIMSMEEKSMGADYVKVLFADYCEKIQNGEHTGEHR